MRVEGFMIFMLQHYHILKKGLGDVGWRAYVRGLVCAEDQASTLLFHALLPTPSRLSALLTFPALSQFTHFPPF